MRLGKVFVNVGYVVDLDNENMVDSARASVVEDIHNMVKFGEVSDNIEVKEDSTAKEEDIPEFLKGEEEEEHSLCLDCLERMEIETDIQLCQKCMENYDTDRLWQEHDAGEIDALDFNESAQMRMKYRKEE